MAHHIYKENVGSKTYIFLHIRNYLDRSRGKRNNNTLSLISANFI